MKIGIAISTRNRPEVFNKTYSQWNKFSPPNSVIIVVDDASILPVKSDFRFEYQAGIAAVKNKCIELLINHGCTHLFLSDDDCYPIQSNWYKPYIQSKYGHLSMTFTKPGNGVEILGGYDNCTVYNKPCGCMIYVTHETIKKVGGFDPDYPIWGMEHIDFSQRCVNHGITPYLAMDIQNSTSFFHSMDYYGTAIGTVSKTIKQKLVSHSRNRFEHQRSSKEVIPYNHSNKGIILVSYFNSIPDGQRGRYWKPHTNDLQTLIESCQKNGCQLKIFHDCLPVADDGMFIKVRKNNRYSPNVYRWIVYNKYIQDLDTDNIFMLDATDVEILRYPFNSLNPNKLYVGNEESMPVDNSWMQNTQEPLFNIPDYRKIIRANGTKTLVNCGIVGGSIRIVKEYLAYRAEYHDKYTKGIIKSTDMAIFNYIIWKHFSDRITQGIKVNTHFKKFEADNGISFFKHK